MMYEVTWSLGIEASNPVDAARQAWEEIKDPASPATILVVRRESGEHVITLDMEDPRDPLEIVRSNSAMGEVHA